MASVVVTMRIMPNNPEIDLSGLESKAKKEKTPDATTTSKKNETDTQIPVFVNERKD